MAGQTMFTSQKQSLTLTLKNAGGTIVSQPDAVPQWATSDPSIVTVQPAADGLSAVATAAGAQGQANVTASVDGVTATYTFTVQSNQVASITINQFGLPQAK